MKCQHGPTQVIEALEVELVEEVSNENYRKQKGIQIPREPQAPLQLMRRVSHPTPLSARNKGNSVSKKFVFGNPGIGQTQ